MKPITELIDRVRRETRNKTTGTYTAGGSIDDVEFVDRLNEGQELAYELISGVFSSLFEETKIYTIDTSLASPEEFDLPSDIMFGTRVCSVEYSYSGDEADYSNIPPVDIRERYSGTSYLRSMMGYMITANKLILSEVPAQNGSKIRVVYEKRPLRLDQFKATVDTTFSRSGTDLTIDYTEASAHSDIAAYWDIGDTVNCIDRRTNTIIVQDGLISAINTTTRDITLDLTDATYTAATVDAITTDSAETHVRLIEGGRTNLSTLPSECEKFMVAYAALEIHGRDGSRLAEALEKRAARFEQSLIKSYLSASKDWPAVPETDY